MDAEVQAAVEARWVAETAGMGTGSTWVETSLRPVLAVASAHPDLRRLFPFTSLNRLCFSRCSAYPYTFDCPCVGARHGHYVVLSSWAASYEPVPILVETDDPNEAVEVVVAHLPEDRHVWIGAAKR